MTSRDFITAEAGNTDRIMLYREGLFWKAYERSAFAVCTQLRSFKPTKKALKTLGGEHLVSIGFPTRSEEAVLGGLERIAEEENRLELAALRPIATNEFEAWKAAVALTEPRPVKSAADPQTPVAAADVPDDPDGDVPVPGVPNSVTRVSPVYGEADFSLTAACRVADSLKDFDLADKTPMECMLFISELKKILANR